MSKVTAIKASMTTLDIVEVVGAPDAHGRHMALCPIHDDHTPSLRIFADGQGWLCFVCGAKGGDVIDLVAARDGIDQRHAISRLHAQVSDPTFETAARSAPEPEDVDRRAAAELIPIPEIELPQPGETELTYVADDERVVTFQFDHAYPYRRSDGTAHHLVIRRDARGDRRKVIIQIRWDGERYRSGAQPKPRTLYGLQLLDGARQIIVVEGEKAADRLNTDKQIAGLQIAAVTSPGGAQAFALADWTPLEGRHVVFWPDADKPGREAMGALMQRLRPELASAKWIDTTGLRGGADAADVPPGTDIVARLKKRARTDAEIVERRRI